MKTLSLMSRRTFYITLLLATFVIPAHSKQSRNVSKTLFEILQKNKSQLDSVKQLLVVENDTEPSCKAVLIALEKKHHKWQIKFGPMDAYIGRNGFALPGTKSEGDGKTPTGIYSFGQLFSYENDVDTHLPYIQTTVEDKWIDDPQSDDYNKYIRGETSARSFEKLLIRSDAYKYCMVINYNTHPVLKGKGSAIFFHLGEEPTSGCVTITEENMKLILNWMNTKAKPSVLMGNVDVLQKGLGFVASGDSNSTR